MREETGGLVLIWDNARFHLGGELLTIAKQYQIRIVQLPAYSPDFNPIEPCWATLKHHLRLALGKGSSLDEAKEMKGFHPNHIQTLLRIFC